MRWKPAGNNGFNTKHLQKSVGMGVLGEGFYLVTRNYLPSYPSTRQKMKLESLKTSAAGILEFINIL